MNYDELTALAAGWRKSFGLASKRDASGFVGWYMGFQIKIG